MSTYECVWGTCPCMRISVRTVFVPLLYFVRHFFHRLRRLCLRLPTCLHAATGTCLSCCVCQHLCAHARLLRSFASAFLRHCQCQSEIYVSVYPAACRRILELHSMFWHMSDKKCAFTLSKALICCYMCCHCCCSSCVVVAYAFVILRRYQLLQLSSQGEENGFNLLAATSVTHCKIAVFFLFLCFSFTDYYYSALHTFFLPPSACI